MNTKNELFEETAVYKVYFKLALPVVFSMVVSLIYNLVDTFFIARTGNTNLVAGISIATPIFTLLISFGDIFGLGGSSIISRLLGQKHEADARRLSVFCFYASFLYGIAVMIVMLLFCKPILNLLGADKDTMYYASEYFKIIVLGAPVIIISYVPTNLLRTEGFSTVSMTGTILGAVINIVLDPIFIFTLNMGAAGAALATVIGNICTDLFFIWFLITKSKILSINPKELSITLTEIGTILSIGIPASATNFMQSFALIQTNRCLLHYGSNKLAAMGIVMKVNLIVVLILVGFAFGAQPLIGYNYGAENKLRLKKILQFCYGFECIISGILSIVVSVKAPALISIFIQDDKIVKIGTPMLRMQETGIIFMSIVLVTTSAFQSTGKALGALILSISRQGVVFFFVLQLGSHFFGYNGILLAQAVSDILTAVLAIILFRQNLFFEIKMSLPSTENKYI